MEALHFSLIICPCSSKPSEMNPAGSLSLALVLMVFQAVALLGLPNLWHPKVEQEAFQRDSDLQIVGFGILVVLSGDVFTRLAFLKDFLKQIPGLLGTRKLRTCVVCCCCCFLVSTILFLGLVSVL